VNPLVDRLRPPPPLGRRTDAVNYCTPARYCIMATPSPDYLFKHVKHGTQNIQKECHQWLSDSFRVHRIGFRPGICPDPVVRAYSAPIDPVSVLRRPLLRGGERGRGKETDLTLPEGQPPTYANSWIHPGSRL